MDETTRSDPKLDTDSAFNDSQAGIWVVGLNHHGAVNSGHVPHVTDAANAEALALIRGLCMVFSMGLQDVIVESDCLTLGITKSRRKRLYTEEKLLKQIPARSVKDLPKLPCMHCGTVTESSDCGKPSFQLRTDTSSSNQWSQRAGLMGI